MGTVTAEKLAAEFVRILGEGWKPDLDEFLGRVPEQHREECRGCIEQLARRNGLSVTPRPSEPEPGPRESADDEALEWIERQVCATGADAGPFSIVAEADPQPAGAAEEGTVMKAPDDHGSEAVPVVRVKQAIDELWGHVGAEQEEHEEAAPPVVRLLSVADELTMTARRPTTRRSTRETSSRPQDELKARPAAPATEPQPVSAEEAMDMWRVQRRRKRPNSSAPLR